MWSDVVSALDFALIWLLGLSLLFALTTQPRVSAVVVRMGHPLLIVTLVALAVRLVPLLLLPVGAGYDIESFQLTGDALLGGRDVYTSAAAGRHPYLPLQMYIIGVATFLSRMLPLPFVIWIKLSGLAADIFISALIYESYRRRQSSTTEAAYWAFLYALNPIAVLVSVYHGQFDAVAVLLLLLAWFRLRFGDRLVRSALWLGFAILNKTWPLVFLPIAFIRLPSIRQRLRYALLSLTVPILFTAAYTVLFAADPIPMLRRALTHSGVPGYWGFSTLAYLAGSTIGAVQGTEWSFIWQRAVLLLAGVLVLWLTRRQSALDALLTVILTMFVLTFGMGLQWLLWPVAFAILAREGRWTKWYTLLGALMIAVHLYLLHLAPWHDQLLDPATANTLLRLISLPVWLVVVFWAASRLRRARMPGAAGA